MTKRGRKDSGNDCSLEILLRWTLLDESKELVSLSQDEKRQDNLCVCDMTQIYFSPTQRVTLQMQRDRDKGIPSFQRLTESPPSLVNFP
ncbi:hypothetical protein K0M31_015564 [Melipona bicolor]|uniref:Uncharacterized protein n=1 Tax=Melipona bicolor TaxID=60889 RepID=A0AA40FG66_9HYME|nr:hypothetical protein K0M31_015564 [Melipona bicolor]